MARIPYPNLDQLNDKDRQFFSSLPGGLNIFKMLAHAGETGKNFVKLGASVLYQGKLDPLLREMAIIRTGILCGSDYEVHQHWAMARKLGMSDEKIKAVDTGSSSPVFSDLEKLVLRFTEELVQDKKTSDEIFHELLLHLDYATISELTITVGYYTMVSVFLRNFEIEIEK